MTMRRVGGSGWMVLTALGTEARLSFLKVEKNGAGVDGIGEGLVYSSFFFFLTRSRTFFLFGC